MLRRRVSTRGTFERYINMKDDLEGQEEDLWSNILNLESERN